MCFAAGHWHYNDAKFPLLNSDVTVLLLGWRDCCIVLEDVIVHLLDDVLLCGLRDVTYCLNDGQSAKLEWRSFCAASNLHSIVRLLSCLVILRCVFLAPRSVCRGNDRLNCTKKKECFTCPPYSDWSPCDAECGGLRGSQWRKIVSTGYLASCDNGTETRPCISDVCPCKSSTEHDFHEENLNNVTIVICEIAFSVILRQKTHARMHSQG